jgi:hypothetical protein
MLTFTQTDTLYTVTETQMSFSDTRVMTIDYTKDLTKKRVNNEPFRGTLPADVRWFNNHYRKHFDK